MATSAIRFGTRSIYIRDSELGEVLKALTFSLPEAVRLQSPRLDWLVEALKEWCTDYEELPPGLKDVELDDCLTDDTRIDSFKGYVKEIIATAPPVGIYDATLVQCHLVKILDELL
jgi:hypothetical protein